MFFDDKPLEPPKAKVHGFFATIGLWIIGFILDTLALILKPYIKWSTNIEGKNRKEAYLRLSVIVIPILIVVLLVYKIPFVRDAISLSTTHTINATKNGYRLEFPDRSFFAIESRSREFYLRQGGPRYITYSGYTGTRALRTESNTCYPVTRSEKITLRSLYPPHQAEGFEEVTYQLERNLSLITGWRYAWVLVKNPSSLVSKGDPMIKYEVTGKWNEFERDWSDIPLMNEGYRPFELKALSNEHAVACF